MASVQVWSLQVLLLLLTTLSGKWVMARCVLVAAGVYTLRGVSHVLGVAVGGTV